jgi:hypothetical protein
MTRKKRNDNCHDAKNEKENLNKKKMKTMKTNYLLSAAIAVVSLGMTGCSQSEDVADGTSAKQTITFASEDETTRTSMGGAYTDTTFPFYWEVGDKIWINAKDEIGGDMTAPARNAIFSGNVTTAATYNIRYTGTGSYTSNNQRVAIYSFTTTSDGNTLVIPPVQSIATWAEGAATKRIGANGDCGTATAINCGSYYKFKLDHKAAYLILMPRWTGNDGTYKLKSVTVTTQNNSYLLSGRFGFSDTGIGSAVTSTNGSATIKITTGGSEGLILPTSKDQTQSINIAIKPVADAIPLYCIYEVSDGTNTYYIEKIVGSTAHSGTLTADKSFAANTITPITADIKAGYDLASTDGYLDLITNNNPYSGFYEWDVPNGEEYFVSHEMKDDYNAKPVTAYAPTAVEGARTNWCTNSNFNALTTLNQISWYLKGGCYWQADKKWGPADNQKGGMWFKKKAYLISSGVVTDETAFNTTQSGIWITNPVKVKPDKFNTTNWFFLPAVGLYVNGNFILTGTNAGYWLSTPYYTNDLAEYLNFNSSNANSISGSRFAGMCIWGMR